MKPWNNPLYLTVCYICGRKGWNPKALDAWTGTQFFCSKGCDPKDVENYVKKKLEKNQQA